MQYTELFIKAIDWELLREQKLWLIHKGEECADGLLSLIDCLQDVAVKDGIVPDTIVFEEV